MWEWEDKVDRHKPTLPDDNPENPDIGLRRKDLDTCTEDIHPWTKRIRKDRTCDMCEPHNHSELKTNTK